MNKLYPLKENISRPALNYNIARLNHTLYIFDKMLKINEREFNRLNKQRQKKLEKFYMNLHFLAKNYPNTREGKRAAQLLKIT